LRRNLNSNAVEVTFSIVIYKAEPDRGSWRKKERELHGNAGGRGRAGTEEAWMFFIGADLIKDKIQTSGGSSATHGWERYSRNSGEEKLVQ